MLLRFDPFRELDRVADQAFAPRAPAVPMDAVRRGDHVEITFELPGIDPDAIDLEVERNVLTVRAERHVERREGDEVLAAERRYGSFTRQLMLGDTLDPTGVDARYEDGLLRVTIPAAEEARPRRITVGHGNGGPREIQADARESTSGEPSPEDRPPQDRPPVTPGA